MTWRGGEGENRKAGRKSLHRTSHAVATVVQSSSEIYAAFYCASPTVAQTFVLTFSFSSKLLLIIKSILKNSVVSFTQSKQEAVDEMPSCTLFLTCSFALDFGLFAVGQPGSETKSPQLLQRDIKYLVKHKLIREKN